MEVRSVLHFPPSFPLSKLVAPADRLLNTVVLFREVNLAVLMHGHLCRKVISMITRPIYT